MKTALREARDLDTVAKLRRDNYSVGDWTITTDGGLVWITKQKSGSPCEFTMEIPKKVFDRLLFYYDRPQQHTRR